jgi:hypothetical protein
MTENSAANPEFPIGVFPELSPNSTEFLHAMSTRHCTRSFHSDREVDKELLTKIFKAAQSSPSR